MHSFPRFSRRVLAAAIFGLLIPAVTLAQSAAPKHAAKQTSAKQAAARQLAASQAAAAARADSIRQDSVRRDSIARDSAATHTATSAGKRSRLGALGRSALSKANSAADKVAQTTGVSKETMAEAALATTGVGAAAMLAKPGATGTQAKVGEAVGRTVLQRMQEEKAARAAGAGAMPGMTAQQMAIYRQQMAAQQMAMAQAGGGMGAGESAEMQKLQTDYMQIVLRAQSGDTVAVKQLMRFQQEMATVGLRMQSVAPDRQQAAYESALRDALQCATSGRSCHAGKM